jgi:hypothetical protein
MSLSRLTYFHWLLLPLISILLALSCPAKARAEFDSLAFMQELSSLEDRSLGSKGYYRAAGMVERALESSLPEIGGKMVRQYFHAPVRRHQGSSIRIGSSGEKHPIHPVLGNAIWPGTVAEPGINGRLVYAGHGSLSEMSGKEIKGQVVLMEMFSGKNWLNAASLGAKALIYLDSGDDAGAPRTRFDDKQELTPLPFPRFWMTRERARRMFGDYVGFSGGSNDPQVTLTSSLSWQNAEGINILCRIPGSNPKLEDEVLVIQAFYDSSAWLPGLSPGADESAGIASLISLSADFKMHPPQRPVLLVATGGRSQALAGMREFIWASTGSSRRMRNARRQLKKQRSETRNLVKLLKRENPLAAAKGEGQALLNQAISDQIKKSVEQINTQLIELRLGKKDPASEASIKELAATRLTLRRLGWQSDFSHLKSDELKALLRLVPAMKAQAEQRAADVASRYKAMDSSYKTRRMTSGKRVVASVSLDLGSHGDGLGSFSQGWMYELNPGVDRTRAYKLIDRILKNTASSLHPSGRGLYRDALRPDLRYPWQNYLPEKPALAGEVAALAGWPGFSLATTHDLRVRQGTPYDRFELVNQDFIKRQNELVQALISALANKPLPDPGITLPKGFVSLSGRANLLRQGALFPDLPAAGALIQVYQGPRRYFYTMVDTGGRFRASGLANRKHTVHKAILETYGFSNDGSIKWAVDKKQTGRESYRVRMKRFELETGLVLFTCRQTTLFNTLEPRTFNFMWRLELIDARTETQPMRYWYSRLDTWTSSIQAIFMEPGAYLKAALSDTVLGRKMLLLNSSSDAPQGQGFAMANNPIIPATEYQAARDMWLLLGQRIKNLEDKGIFNQRISGLKDNGLRTLAEAEEAGKASTTIPNTLANPANL